MKKSTFLARKADEEDSEFLELPSQLKPLHAFVSEVVRERGGVKLENEIIVPGIRHCAAARVMMQVNWIFYLSIFPICNITLLTFLIE